MPAIAAVLVAVVLAVTAAPAAGQDAGYKVVVHPTNPGTVVSRPVLAGIFKGQTNRWGDGSPIVPVDQSAKSAVRVRFVKDVMNESVAAVMAYWARQMMGGRARPPVVKGSDAEVIEFVAKTDGAIGYVGSDAVVPDTVKVLQVE